MEEDRIVNKVGVWQIGRVVKMKYKITATFEFEPLDDATLIDEVQDILPNNAEFEYEKVEG